MKNLEEIVSIIKYLGPLSVLGGVVRYVHEVTSQGKKFKWSIFFSRALTSGFSGIMFTLFVMSFTDNVLIIGWTAGMSGYFGNKGLEFLVEIFKKFIKGK